MKKNGFTLAECVVAISVALAVCFIMASASVLAVSNTNKSKALNIGLNEFENVTKIILNTDLESENVYNPKALENKLKILYEKNFSLSQDNLKSGVNIIIKFDKNFAINEKGKTQVVFYFKQESDYFVFGGEVKLQNKSLYINKNIIQKRVGWQNV